LTNLLLDKITGTVDSGGADVDFLDFAKAFDKVPHNRVQIKLLNHGVTGVLQKWIMEWLNGRRTAESGHSWHFLGLD